MKYNLNAINIYSSGSISIDYRKLSDSGEYLGSVENDSNLSCMTLVMNKNRTPITDIKVSK